MTKKERLDDLVILHGLAETREEAAKLIMSGEIRTGDRVWEKSGEKIPADTVLELKSRHCKWVSKGGLKLEKALKDFHVNPAGMRCLDIGASTGGFTHVLLDGNAKEVVALDVGQQLLDPRIQNDSRVIIKDKTNFRLISDDELGEPFDLVVTDVSFISLRNILPKAAKMLKSGGAIIALIKPQFEAEKHLVPEGGVITDPELQISIIKGLKETFKESKLNLCGLSPVPLVSKKKNIEFTSLWKLMPEIEPDIERIVQEAHLRS